MSLRHVIFLKYIAQLNYAIRYRIDININIKKARYTSITGFDFGIIRNYLAASYLLFTSSQLITLKNALM